MVTVGLDIVKSVFQVHCVDVNGNVVLLKRRHVLAFFQKLPPCLVGIEACASSHHWSRQLQAFGHTVRLMPPAYVKPYVKRQKNDAADAEAICEAVTRPPVTITHGISIQAHGFGGITQTSDPGAAITVSVTTSDPVSLNGLLIDGAGTGQYGIHITSGPSVQILNASFAISRSASTMSQAPTGPIC
jgi:hypothetical protein